MLFWEFLLAVIMIAALAVFFGRFKKKPLPIILGICYLLVIVTVFSAGIITTIPMPCEEIQINFDEASESTDVKLYSVVSDGRTYAVISNENGKLGLKEIFDNDINKNLEEAQSVNGSVSLNVPIGSGRSVAFLSTEQDCNVDITFKGEVFSHNLKSNDDSIMSVPLKATGAVYDNFIKIIRLVLFCGIIVLIMAIPIWLVYKHEFKKYDKFFSKVFKTAAELFKTYKVETILCLISTVLAFFMFLYMDLNSLTAWSMDFVDGLLRGGFIGRNDIEAQNLWNAYHGATNEGFVFSLLFWGIWNLPVLLIHYFFKLPFELTEPIMFWSKLCLEIMVIGLAVLCYKIVKYLTNNKQNGLLAFILTVGSVTTLFGIGYSGQNEIFYLFFLLLGLYEILVEKKNLGLLFLCITTYDNPSMIIYTALIIICISDKMREILWRLGAVLLSAVLSMKFMVGGTGTSSTNEINRMFNKTLLSTGYGTVSFFALSIVLIYFIQFSIKRKEKYQNRMFLIYSLCLISMSFFFFGYSYMYRYQVFTVFIIICVLTIKNDKIMTSGVLGLCVFEYAFTIVTISIYNSYFNFSRLSEGVKKILDIDQAPNISLYNYIKISHPDISTYLPILQGIALAAGLWILYVSYPKRKTNSDSELTCKIPLRALTAVFVSSSLIIIGLVTVLGIKMNHVASAYSGNITEAITGENYIEEYFQGKSAKWVQLTFRPSTGGKTYPKNQLLQVDIIDAESGEIIGTNSCSASDFKDGKNYSLLIEDVKMNSDKWYIFRFSSPDIIKNENNYMYLTCSQSGTANEESHYAMVNVDNQYVAADYDIIGEIYTG